MCTHKSTAVCVCVYTHKYTRVCTHTELCTHGCRKVNFVMCVHTAVVTKFCIWCLTDGWRCGQSFGPESRMVPFAFGIVALSVDFATNLSISLCRRLWDNELLDRGETEFAIKGPYKTNASTMPYSTSARVDNPQPVSLQQTIVSRTLATHGGSHSAS